jgi:hypothetical protein
MTQVNDEQYVINDHLCSCGSTVTVRGSFFNSPQGGSMHFEAWCTDHPSKHPVPDAIAAEVADLNTEFGGGSSERNSSMC